MNEKFTSNNDENDEFYLDTEDSDYKNLVITLKEISTTIAELEKTILR